MRRWAASAAAARNNTRPSPPRSEQCPASRGSPTTGEPLFAAERPGAGRGPQPVSLSARARDVGARGGRARRPRACTVCTRSAGGDKVLLRPHASRHPSLVTHHPSPTAHPLGARFVLISSRRSLPITFQRSPAGPRAGAAPGCGVWLAEKSSAAGRAGPRKRKRESREASGLKALAFAKRVSSLGISCTRILVSNGIGNLPPPPLSAERHPARASPLALRRGWSAGAGK